ncbi:MAG: type II toxin-antitoxin system prevent-host-death family antitoxin [Rubrivivax sp.]|nr:type II toxin-antitoxin system prevent-host-death family antitoxin [Rubrivivax sp.]
MITETSAVAFRQNLGEMLNIVQYRNDSVLIKKDGKPVAALIDARLFLRIRQMQERFDALCDRLAQGHAGVPQAEGVAAIDAAAKRARRETAAAWRAAGRLPALPAEPAAKPARKAARPAPQAKPKRKSAAPR